MKRIDFILIGVAFLATGCTHESPVKREAWIEEPLSQWPDIALTNEIAFDDTTYTDLANSFLINTGYDTLGVSCKHIFMVFEKHQGLNSIDLGNSFKYWKLYPKNDTAAYVNTRSLINADPNETIGQFNTLKVRDWILFEIDIQNSGIYPLKIRHTPIKTHEVVYAPGWGMKQKDNSMPALIKFQCVENLGNYYYMRTLTTDIHPAGRSGSPVIDKNGYLVGLISGAEGSYSVIGSVKYLRSLFYTYGVEYHSPGP